MSDRSRSLGPFRPVALSAHFIAPGVSDVARHATVRATGAAENVALPPLPTGRHTLPWMQLYEHPPDATWQETVFRSATPWVVEFRDVLVHSDGGIICAGAE